MRLSETGEARVRGYLYVLKRSLEASLPASAIQDSLQEIESHLRERIDETEPQPDERTALETVLTRLGEPLEVARAYSGELLIDQAVVTGRIVATGRALWHLATSTVLGFVQAMLLLLGYSLGLSLLAIAALKPIFPDNVGLIIRDGIPQAFGVIGAQQGGVEVAGGYWVIPIAIALGLGILVLTHKLAKRALLSWRARRARRGLSQGAPPW